MKCFFCKGNMKAATTTHVVTLKSCIIIVKNVPCVECPQCGETYFEDDVAARLEAIVKGLDDAVTEIAIVNYTDKVA